MNAKCVEKSERTVVDNGIPQLKLYDDIFSVLLTLIICKIYSLYI